MEKAIETNNTLLFALCLEKLEDIDADLSDRSNLPALHYACKYDRALMVDMLLDRGAKTTHEQNFSALEIAAGNGCYDVVKLLLERNVNPNEEGAKTGWTALRLAHFYGYKECVALLLQAGAHD